MNEQHNLVTDPINVVQQHVFDLMHDASFNRFDGPAVVASLKTHRGWWDTAFFGRDSDDIQIVLRDMSHGEYNADTLWIMCMAYHADELMEVAKTKWRTSEVDLIKPTILRVWWD